MRIPRDRLVTNAVALLILPLAVLCLSVSRWPCAAGILGCLMGVFHVVATDEVWVRTCAPDPQSLWESLSYLRG